MERQEDPHQGGMERHGTNKVIGVFERQNGEHW